MMKPYEGDTFYDVRDLPLETKIQILDDSFKLKTDYHIDILEVEKSSSRRRIDMVYEEVIKKLATSSHFVFIHRKEFLEPAKGEIGFCTMNLGPAYYLFIYTSLETLLALVEKYNLSPM